MTREKKYTCVFGCGRKVSKKDSKCFYCIDVDGNFSNRF